MAHNTYDILSKSIIEDFVIDFLHFFYPKADEVFDLSEPVEFLDTELSNIDPNRFLMKDSMHVDKLLKIRVKSEKEKCMLLLVEVQKSNDEDFAKRVHAYLHRLLDKYGECVSVLVIYTNRSKRYQPKAYYYNGLNTYIETRFACYDVIGQEEEMLLKQDDNVFAIFLLIILWSLKITKKTEDLIFEKMKALVQRIEKNVILKGKLCKILEFLKLYPRFGKEFQCVVDEYIDSIIIKNKTMGIFEIARMITAERAEERGEERMRNKRNTDFVTRLLQESDFTIGKIARIVDVPISFVKSVQKKMLIANA